MKPSKQAYELIKSFEGLRCRAYKALAAEKYFTIGYGHCGPDVKQYQVISPQHAEELLERDVAQFADKLDKDTTGLTQNQFDALCSFIYNVGWYGYRYSMTREAIRQINQKTTPLQCARRITWWVRASGTVLLGLQARRVIEANHFLGHEYFKLQDGRIIEQ